MYSRQSSLIDQDYFRGRFNYRTRYRTTDRISSLFEERSKFEQIEKKKFLSYYERRKQKQSELTNRIVELILHDRLKTTKKLERLQKRKQILFDHDSFSRFWFSFSMLGLLSRFPQLAPNLTLDEVLLTVSWPRMLSRFRSNVNSFLKNPRQIRPPRFDFAKSAIDSISTSRIGQINLDHALHELKKQLLKKERQSKSHSR